MDASLNQRIRDQLSDHPQRLAWLEAQYAASGQAVLRQLIEAVDDSAFPLEQWLGALMVLEAWLRGRGLRAPLDAQIGYIGCACAAAGASPAYQSLTPLVEDMLAEYGFERAVRIGETEA